MQIIAYITLFFGVLIALAGGGLIVKPAYLFNLFTEYGDSLGFHVFAVIVRVIMGVAMVISAADSKYPLTLQIMGWLIIFAAFILTVMGRERFKRLAKWAMTLPKIARRSAAIFGIFLGCFLVYAVI